MTDSNSRELNPDTTRLSWSKDLATDAAVTIFRLKNSTQHPATLKLSASSGGGPVRYFVTERHSHSETVDTVIDVAPGGAALYQFTGNLKLVAQRFVAVPATAEAWITTSWQRLGQAPPAVGDGTGLSLADDGGGLAGAWAFVGPSLGYAPSGRRALTLFGTSAFDVSLIGPAGASLGLWGAGPAPSKFDVPPGARVRVRNPGGAVTPITVVDTWTVT